MRLLRRSGSSTGAEYILLLFILSSVSAGSLLERTLNTGTNLFEQDKLIIIGSGLTGAAAAYCMEDRDGHRGILPFEPFTTMDRIDNAAFGYALPAASVALWAGGEVFRKNSIASTGESLCRGLFYTYGITEILKRGTQRERPDGSNFRSFPSAHGAGAACAAAVLWNRHGPEAGIPAAAVALYTCISRVNTGVHYPSDVVMGAALGTACGLAAAAASSEEDRADDGIRLGISINSNGRITPVLW